MFSRASACARVKHLIFFCTLTTGAQLYNPRLLEIVARRPVYVRLALWFLHHPAWVEGHTGGSWLTPTVHPCPVPK